MRRWWAALLCAVALGVTAACGSPPYGIDGDLTDEWVPPPEPQAFRPADSGCFDDIRPTVALADYAPFDCAKRHVAGDVLRRRADREGGREERGRDRARPRSAAAAECGRRAVPFLGAEHRTGSSGCSRCCPAPRAGRPARAGSAATRSRPTWAPARRSAAPAACATPSRAPRRWPCAASSPPSAARRSATMTAVACAKSHDAEFAGLWTAPDIAFRRSRRRRPDGERLPVGHRRLGQGPGRR